MSIEIPLECQKITVSPEGAENECQSVGANTTVKATAPVTWKRDEYGALEVQVGKGANRSKLGRCWAATLAILRDLEKGNADEHRAPAWETGAAFDHKGRGEAINIAVYGMALIGRQNVAVVQVRQYSKRTANGWPRLRKNYFLVGRNEGTGQPFAHPIPSAVVHAAIRRDDSPESPVTAARAWIFDVPIKKLRDILRHGDVAAVPVRSVPSGERLPLDTTGGLAVIDSHILTAPEAVRIGQRLYARNPVLRHSKDQHPDVSAVGWHRIQVGHRADFWRFARPTAD